MSSNIWLDIIGCLLLSVPVGIIAVVVLEVVIVMCERYKK